jgi:hypothetical protein
MLLSSSSSSPWLVNVHASTLGFMVSKYVMRRGITTFKSYLKTNQIAFPYPNNFFTIHNDLNKRSNMMANMLWTWSK